MKKNNLGFSNELTACCLVFFTMLLLASCSSGSNEQEHPGNHADEKDAPIDKVLKTSQGNDSTNETFWNSLPPNHIVISKQATVVVGDNSQQYTLNGNGYITFDLSRNRKVPVRIGGRIERLYTKYNYQYVKKGEKILDLYSPELNTYVSEYLYLKRRTSDSVMIDKAIQKLLLLGLSRAQILKINQSETVPYTISIYSPFEGYVLFNPSAAGSSMGNQSTSGAMPDEMNGSASGSYMEIPGTTLPDNTIREGMYVSKGQTLFWINDFQQAWGILAFSHKNEKKLEPGLTVLVKSELFSDQILRSVISTIEPVYSSEQKFTQVRLHLPNTGNMLKQNSLITGTVTVSAQSIIVPANSVYFLGNTAIVWVQKAITKEGSNVFQARSIEIGSRNTQNIEVLKGLNRGDIIAKDAGYLADSESIIQY
ncbi:efflux RND transporter periplasmic adaptor subunit [Pedobacter immunditicola]|uniref:efflux RND transporter periplasmic adaptor subunit n=1 Tax=Pedobacter immunditicola TaxID=3133440 RepID=UPI003096C969